MLLICELYRIVSIYGRCAQATDSCRWFRVYLSRLSRAAADEYLARAADQCDLRLCPDAAEAVERRAPDSYRDRVRFAEKNFPRRPVRGLQEKSLRGAERSDRPDSIYPSRRRSLSDQEHRASWSRSRGRDRQPRHA